MGNGVSWSWCGECGVMELVWGMVCPGGGVGNGVSWSWCGEWGLLSVYTNLDAVFILLKNVENIFD